MENNGLREDDAKWPKRNKDGRQELEIRLGNEHISFDVRTLFVVFLPCSKYLCIHFDWGGLTFFHFLFNVDFLDF